MFCFKIKVTWVKITLLTWLRSLYLSLWICTEANLGLLQHPRWRECFVIIVNEYVILCSENFITGNVVKIYFFLTCRFSSKTQPAVTCSKLTIRTRCEIWSKLTIKIPERRHWRRSEIFIVNFEHISHLVLVFLLLTLSIYLPTV